MAREITTTGSKKISTFLQEFNDHFPYLTLEITPYSEDNYNKTFSELRSKKGKGEISFTGNKNVSTIENEFKNILGINIEVGFTKADGVRLYSNLELNKKSLSELNSYAKEKGYMSGKWK